MNFRSASVLTIFEDTSYISNINWFLVLNLVFFGFEVDFFFFSPYSSKLPFWYRLFGERERTPTSFCESRLSLIISLSWSAVDFLWCACLLGEFDFGLLSASKSLIRTVYRSGIWLLNRAYLGDGELLQSRIPEAVVVWALLIREEGAREEVFLLINTSCLRRLAELENSPRDGVSSLAACITLKWCYVIFLRSADELFCCFKQDSMHSELLQYCWLLSSEEDAINLCFPSFEASLKIAGMYID